MNNAAIQAYGTIQQSTIHGRTLEGRGFARAASLLREAKDTLPDRRKMVEALQYNNRLWTIVQAAVSSEGRGGSVYLNS